MTKIPLVGEVILADIAGRWLHVTNYPWPDGERFYQIVDIFKPFLDDPISFCCITQVPNSDPQKNAYFYLNDLEWLEEHQIWILKDIAMRLF